MRRRFEIVAELSPVGIFESNAQGECVFVNERWRKLTGLTNEEASGYGWMSAIHPDDRTELLALWAESQRTAADGTMEYRFLRGHEVVWVEASGRALVDDAGQLSGYLGTVVDVTARKQAEVALRARHEETQRILDSLPDGVIIDEDGVMTFANRRAAELLRADSAAALVGTRSFDYVHPDDHGQLVARVRARTELNETTGPGAFRMVRRDGSIVRVESFGTRILVGGKPATIVAMRDISQRLALEERVQQSERMASLGALAAGVAHEINNPLHTIVLNLAQMEQSAAAGGVHPERANELAEIIADVRTASQHIQKIVSGLAVFARSGRDEVPAPTPVRRVIDTAAMLARFQLQQHCRFKKGAAPEVQLLAVESKLVQVLVNLLVNAAQAKRGDAIHTVTLEAACEEALVCIHVHDTGSGMSADVQARIFEPFFTTKPAGAGTGLGLSISRGIIEEMGGSFRVKSEPGVGTTMTVCLPLAPPP